MKNGGGGGGGTSGETVPLLSARTYDQNGGQYVKSQQQSNAGGPVHSYHPNQANSDPILMAQYAAAASAGNPMAAYAFAAAAQYDPNDYGATTNGYNSGYMPAGPYGAYYAAPYGYGPPGAGQPGAPPAPHHGSPQAVPVYFGNGGAPGYMPAGGPIAATSNSNMAPPSRPPRVTRRSSGGARLSPSPTAGGTLKKTYVPDNNNSQQQQNSGLSNPKSSDSEDGGGYNHSRNAASNSSQYDSGSGLPPLTDIFSGGSGEETLLRMDSGGGGGGGEGAVYGATTSSSRQRGSGGSSRQQQLQQPVMVRTLSSGDMGKSHPFYSNSSGDRPSKPSNLRKSHRRANSDTPLRAHHRRGSSGGGELLPPKAQKYGSRGRMGSRDFASGGRSRTYSGGGMGAFDLHNSAPTIGLERQRGPRHRRADSASSIHTFSSNYSVGSVVSDIGKSAMFGGVTESGTVQLHKPLEAIRLVMIGSDDDERTFDGRKKRKNKRSKRLGLMDDFQIGKLYKETMPRDPEMFDDYHRITTDIQQGLVPNWETMDNKDLVCNCTCNNCNGCTGKQNLLPHPTYTLTVKDDIYKRVLSEIADSQGMPCGLFFCGHHEDVSHPSIMIAVVIVGILFASMALVAYITRG